MLKNYNRKVEPNTIYQDWNHLDLRERKKWMSVIKDELTTMVEKYVFTPIERSDGSLLKIPIGMKWIFKIKDYGRYHYRLVSKGYIQK